MNQRTAIHSGSRRALPQYMAIFLSVFVLSVFSTLPASASGWSWNPPTTSTTVTSTRTLNGVASANSVYGPDCNVVDAKFLGPGGNADWSATTNLLVFSRIDANGLYQIYTSRPDGSDTNCITCSGVPGGPQANRNKFNPRWDASGRYIVMQGELPNHPGVWMNTSSMFQEQLLNGLWSDLWITNVTGTTWSKLTSTSNTTVDGALGPVLSRDGTHLLWSRLIQSATSTDKFGVWRLELADVNWSAGSVSLSNVRDITPPGGVFYEAHDFSADGTSVVFTADIGHPGTWNQNIWSMRIQDGALTNLTDNTYWNEHAAVTPDGSKITYMSSEPYPWSFLKSDLLMMDASGGSPAQITHFNVSGYVESVPYQVVVVRSRWNADGSKLAVTLQRADTYPARELWILTFAGQCGT